MILGLETARSLAARYGLVMMGHPALTGSYTNGPDQGIAHEVLLGTLFRLAGMDISIFPSPGGRFAFTETHCRAIRDHLLAPLGALAPAWPCPAGGMRFESLPGLCAEYGESAVFLVGGSLFAHSNDLRASTAAFLDAIRERFDERLDTPAAPGSTARPAATQQHFAFRAGFEWDARPSSPYKAAGDLAFRDVRRVELVGKYGEGTRADLRYFEIAPGGYSSHEKHVHTHIIIGARGTGVLVLGARRMTINAMDVAYIEPLQAHQLRNETAEPFGFFCIVDQERDRPMKA
jgi:ribulose-bisphosphate carboxylase large chain